MSQATQTDERSTVSIAHTLTSEVSSSREIIESVTEDDIEEMSDEELVKLRGELKKLEDTVEEARKKKADGVLKDRIEVGDSLYGLNHIQSHNKYVEDDIGAVIMRAVRREIDYTEFVSIKASKLADVAPEIAEIGEAEYTYLR